jgi:hypothetical protein
VVLVTKIIIVGPPNGCDIRNSVFLGGHFEIPKIADLDTFIFWGPIQNLNPHEKLNFLYHSPWGTYDEDFDG